MMVTIPLWLMICLIVGCVPAALIIMIVAGIFAFWLIDEIRGKIKHEE